MNKEQTELKILKEECIEAYPNATSTWVTKISL